MTTLQMSDALIGRCHRESWQRLLQALPKARGHITEPIKYIAVATLMAAFAFVLGRSHERQRQTRLRVRRRLAELNDG